MVTLLRERVKIIPVSAKAVMAAGVMGALAPDLDLLYFYLIDHRQTHHHQYLTHWPIAWVSLILIATCCLKLANNKAVALMALVFGLGGFLHMILDSVVGDIWWFAPFSNQSFAMFTVPARFHPWWLNFFLHCSFGLELLIVAWAVFLYFKQRQP